MAAVLAPLGTPASRREATPRTFGLCRPRFFGVSYSINPWMDPSRGGSAARAMHQWRGLRAVYEVLGHRVLDIEPTPAQPDMVFAANAGVVVGGRALVARFRHDERRGEEAGFTRWFESAGLEVRQARFVNEGEGDLIPIGDVLLAGHGFRTDIRAHREAARYFGMTAVSLRLVDPRFYHLDMALTVLDRDTVAWFPGAFAADSRRTLRRLFPDSIVATEADAVAFGINAASDGRNVVLARGAAHLEARLAERGFTTWPLDISELAKAGGAVKCCTLEIRT